MHMTCRWYDPYICVIETNFGKQLAYGHMYVCTQLQHSHYSTFYYQKRGIFLPKTNVKHFYIIYR